MSKQMSIIESLKRVHEDIFDDMDDGAKDDSPIQLSDLEDKLYAITRVNSKLENEIKGLLNSEKYTLFKGKWEFVKEANYYVHKIKYGYLRVRLEKNWVGMGEDRKDFVCLGLEFNAQIDIFEKKIFINSDKDYEKGLKELRDFAEKIFGIKDMVIRVW